jgi:chaperonin GroES
MIRDSTTATVVDVGTGLLLENGEQRPNDLKIGDVVMFTASYEIKIEIIKGDEFLVIRESNVDAILENYDNPVLEVYDK